MKGLLKPTSLLVSTDKAMADKNLSDSCLQAAALLHSQSPRLGCTMAWRGASERLPQGVFAVIPSACPRCHSLWCDTTLPRLKVACAIGASDYKRGAFRTSNKLFNRNAFVEPLEASSTGFSLES